MKYRISKEFNFEAAHSLQHLPPEHKCHNMHGHSYRFVVTCGGALGQHGFVAGLDYSFISEVVKRKIVDRLDHQNLDEFISPSTAENLARFIFDELQSELPVRKIDVHETATTKVSLRK